MGAKHAKNMARLGAPRAHSRRETPLERKRSVMYGVCRCATVGYAAQAALDVVALLLAVVVLLLLPLPLPLPVIVTRCCAGAGYGGALSGRFCSSGGRTSGEGNCRAACLGKRLS